MADEITERNEKRLHRLEALWTHIRDNVSLFREAAGFSDTKARHLVAIKSYLNIVFGGEVRNSSGEINCTDWKNIPDDLFDEYVEDRDGEEEPQLESSLLRWIEDQSLRAHFLETVASSEAKIVAATMRAMISDLRSSL